MRERDARETRETREAREARERERAARIMSIISCLRECVSHQTLIVPPSLCLMVRKCAPQAINATFRRSILTIDCQEAEKWAEVATFMRHTPSVSALDLGALAEARSVCMAVLCPCILLNYNKNVKRFKCLRQVLRSLKDVGTLTQLKIDVRQSLRGDGSVLLALILYRAFLYAPPGRRISQTSCTAIQP